VQLAGARDFIGRPVREVLPELDRQGFCALLDRVYATGEPFIAYAAPVDVERVPGQAPERLYLDFIYQPIVDEQGRVTGIFAQGHDVTQQTLAAEHRQLLVNELNHRVKNTLATVQSLAHQTLRDADSLAAAKSMLTARLLALSNAHNVLTRENWEGASLPEVVHEATRAHDDPAAPRIDAAGPDLRVGPRVALALSMALHELATNAAKYGALSTDAGAVQVRWERSGERSLALTWRERGGPPVSPRDCPPSLVPPRSWTSDLRA
jgi:two-component sensor histidine kinase